MTLSTTAIKYIRMRENELQVKKIQQQKASTCTS